MAIGQVLEAYDYQGSRWLTIWNFAKASKFSLPLEHATNFQVGEMVTFSEDAEESMEIASVHSGDLPASIHPVIRVPEIADSADVSKSYLTP